MIVQVEYTNSMGRMLYAFSMRDTSGRREVSVLLDLLSLADDLVSKPYLHQDYKVVRA